MDTGWTQWVFDRLKIPYTLVYNADVKKGGLGERFDTIVFASQGTPSILHGYRAGEIGRQTTTTGETPALQRLEYTGGIGLAGASALDAFVRAGGKLVAFDSATEFPVQLFGLPLRPAVSANAEATAANSYFCPGSILRLDVDGTQTYAFMSGGQAWDVALAPSENKGEREVRVLARFASRDLLASGWLSGERTIAGKAALVEARHGAGRVVLFGFRPQFRGQTWGTFGLLADALAERSE
jgi:hypothetical protein